MSAKREQMPSVLRTLCGQGCPRSIESGVKPPHSKGVDDKIHWE